MLVHGRGVFNIIPTFWSLSWMNRDPKIMTCFFRHSSRSGSFGHFDLSARWNCVTCFSSHNKKLWDGVQESFRYHLRRWSNLALANAALSPCSSELASLEVFSKFGVLQMTDVHQIRELNCFSILLRLTYDNGLGFCFLGAPWWLFLQFSYYLSADVWSSGIFIASWMETGLCTKQQWTLPDTILSAMSSTCFRFTFQHVAMFSESDCSSLASIDFAIAWSSPRLSSLAMHSKTRTASFCQLSLSSVNILLILCCGALLACNLALPSVFSAICFPSISWENLHKLQARNCQLW